MSPLKNEYLKLDFDLTNSFEDVIGTENEKIHTCVNFDNVNV